MLPAEYTAPQASIPCPPMAIFHGGSDKAVYAYATEDANWWATQLGRTIPPGLFGENLLSRQPCAAGVGRPAGLGDLSAVAGRASRPRLNMVVPNRTKEACGWHNHDKHLGQAPPHGR